MCSGNSDIKLSSNSSFKLVVLLILSFYTVINNAQSSVEKEIENTLKFSDELYDSNPDSSFALCRAVEERVKSLNSNEYDGEISLIKGRYYLLVTEYGKSTEELNKAILFYEENEDLDRLSHALSLKSILLGRIGDTEASHNLLLKAYDLNKQTGNIEGQVNKLMNLSLDFLNPDDLDSANYYLGELDLLKEYIVGSSLYFYNQNWGSYYYLVGDYQNAIKFNEQALRVAKLYDMLDSKATIYMQLAKNYLANDQGGKAKAMAEESYTISHENNLIYEKSEALEQLVAISELNRDFAEGFKYQKELAQTEKEIYNLEKVRKSKEMEGQLFLAQKEKIIAEQQLSIQEGELAASKSKTKNLILYLIISIISLLVFFTFWIYIKSKKLNVSINSQKKIIEQKNEVLEEVFKDINDSLEYSKYIQQAMLPSLEFFKRIFSDHFIFFQPKSIVSGDFYWAKEHDGCVYIAAADCTGHGVPGAMVSIIGYNGLNRCVNELQLKKPSEILDSLSDFVEDSLRNEEKEMKDGMDISLCIIDLNKKKMHYSGANNAIYVLSKGDLLEYRPNKQPVGKFSGRKGFTEKEIELNTGDVIYLFSDGYADQFGGDKGKKLKYKNFKKILLEYGSGSMENQLGILKGRFDDWKGDLEQIDDVCVIGLKV